MFFSSRKSPIALAIFALTLSSALHSDQKKEVEPFPWLTGPLLTPSANVTPQGHFTIEPYEYVTTNYGVFNKDWAPHHTPKSYNVITQIFCTYGLPWNFDLSFTPQFEWNHVNGASHWVLNDFTFGFDYQLLTGKHGTWWWPSIKLNVSANAPIGRFEQFKPRRKGTDNGGIGNWKPSAYLAFSKLYWWGGHIFFAPRLSVQYAVPTPIHVKGINAYGGGLATHGTVYPGQSLNCLFGFEIALSQRWVIAGDIQYTHQNRTRFSGHRGKTAGVRNLIGGPSNEQWSLAPAIEYNWSAYVGLIAGCWFTVAGRNSQEFASGVVAVSIYI